NRMIQSSQSFFDRYEFNEAAKLIYQFTWNDFASWYVEMSKLSDADATKKVLIYVLDKVIKLLHPYMPFVTEEIYQQLPHKEVSIMVSEWPQVTDLDFEDTLNHEWFFELIKKVRSIRNDYHVPWSKPIDLIIKTNQEAENFIKDNQQYIDKFLNPKDLIINKHVELQQTVSIILADIQVHIPLGSLVNINDEINRVEDEIKDLTKEIKRCEGMLNNSNFVNKAPEKKVLEEKTKLKDYRDRFNEAKKRLKALKESHV
ncbi:MAG TPA: class I tRNA ligase family protein, partial [Candidatus Izemoplasmatales bacterium]|nr:class I tRNA ligase family protein [Candidatus Izemoplasmatales bacterium]